MMDLNRYVHRSGLQEVLNNIFRKYNADFWNSVTKAAACHFYTMAELPISHRKTWAENPDIRSMFDTLDKGGNCVDKSVFLASLLTHVNNVETRFTEIDRRPEGHILLETRFPSYDQKQVEEQLLGFYQRNHDFGSYEFAWEERYGKPIWIITDPGLSRYIGDVEALREEGYAETEKDGWGWNYPTESQHV